MNILFIHPNMPGQYKHLARALGAEGLHRIFFITKHKTATIPGVTRITYAMPRLESPPPAHPYLRTSTYAVMQGQRVLRVAQALCEKEKFSPDIIIGHPGWGDMLFLKEYFPRAKILSFFEFYYRATGADVGFDGPSAPDDHARTRAKNITNLLSLEQADWGISPTVWQYSVQPVDMQHKLSVLHDGIDLEFCKPDSHASITLPNGKTFHAGDEVVTYIARNFEPYRGFPTFMKAAEILLKQRPNLHIIAVGADEVSYGRKAPEGKTYRQMLREQVTLDDARIHFIGTLPHAELVKIYQISAAHLYLTYPFVLSWSMLEAMAAGVALVASNTKPVVEVVKDGVNGLLADFHSPADVAAKISQLLDDPARNAAIRVGARATIAKRFDLKKLLPLHVQLVKEVAAGMIPPPVAKDIAAISLLAGYEAAMWEG